MQNEIGWNWPVWETSELLAEWSREEKTLVAPHMATTEEAATWERTALISPARWLRGNTHSEKGDGKKKESTGMQKSSQVQ